MRSAHRSLRVALSLLALAMAWVAQAQEGFVYRVTGEVTLTLAGEARTFLIYAVDIPDDVAEGVANADVRARLEAAAGTTEHGATWEVPEAVSIGSVVISSPTTMAITASARPTEDRDARLGELRLRFELDLATLTLASDAPVDVWYFPEAFSTRNFYALTVGALEVASVERVDASTLHVQGSIAGQFSFQATLVGSLTHDPNDMIVVTGTFDLRQVAGTRPLAEVLPDD